MSTKFSHTTAVMSTCHQNEQNQFEDGWQHWNKPFLVFICCITVVSHPGCTRTLCPVFVGEVQDLPWPWPGWRSYWRWMNETFVSCHEGVKLSCEHPKSKVLHHTVCLLWWHWYYGTRGRKSFLIFVVTTRRVSAHVKWEKFHVWVV